MADDYYRVSRDALKKCQHEVLAKAWHALLDAGVVTHPDGTAVTGWTVEAGPGGVRLSHGEAMHGEEHSPGREVEPLARALAAALGRIPGPPHRFPKQP